MSATEEASDVCVIHSVRVGRRWCRQVALLVSLVALLIVSTV